MKEQLIGQPITVPGQQLTGAEAAAITAELQPSGEILAGLQRDLAAIVAAERRGYLESTRFVCGVAEIALLN